LLPCTHLCPAGTLGFDSLKATLAEKQVRHSLLLTALQVGGVLRQMPPSVLAALFEHAQMLQAAARVLDYQRSCESAASDRDAASQGTALLLACCGMHLGLLLARRVGGQVPEYCSALSSSDRNRPARVLKRPSQHSTPVCAGTGFVGLCLHVPLVVCCPAVDRLQPQASQRAIEAAGSLAAAGAGDVAAAAEQLHTIFFGRPTNSMPALFQAAAAQAAQIRWVKGLGGSWGHAGVLLAHCNLLSAPAFGFAHLWASSQQLSFPAYIQRE
jgi:hypothetical protein